MKRQRPANSDLTTSTFYIFSGNFNGFSTRLVRRAAVCLRHNLPDGLAAVERFLRNSHSSIALAFIARRIGLLSAYQLAIALFAGDTAANMQVRA